MSAGRIARAWRVVPALVLALATGACGDAFAPSAADDFAVQLSVEEPQAVSPEELDALGEAFDRVDSYAVRIVDATTLEVIADTTITISTAGAQHALDIGVPESAFGRTVMITLIAFDGTTELYRSTTTVDLEARIDQIPVELEIRYTGPGVRGTIADALGAGIGGVNVELFEDASPIDLVVTEDDGSYLFLDVPIGTYVVEPVAPVGQNVCPVFRDVFVEQTDDAILADFATQADPCGTSVLVLSGGDFDDTPAVASLLAGNPLLDVSTFFHVNELPTSTYLNEFDVVLLFMNGLFDESAALGTRLADYVAAGGNVVVASFYWQGRSDSGLGSAGWGGLEPLDPFTSTGGARYTTGSLGTVSAHPLTTGVSVLITNSYWGGVTARLGTVTVATWSDGTPLVGYRVLKGGQRMVAVSLFPAVGAAASGDVQVLFDNAVSWAGAAGGPAG